jgi:hypothetical protein
VLRQFTRNAPADAFRRSGDDSDLAIEFHVQNCIEAGHA